MKIKIKSISIVVLFWLMSSVSFADACSPIYDSVNRHLDINVTNAITIDIEEQDGEAYKYLLLKQASNGHFVVYDWYGDSEPLFEGCESSSSYNSENNILTIPNLFIEEWAVSLHIELKAVPLQVEHFKSFGGSYVPALAAFKVVHVARN